MQDINATADANACLCSDSPNIKRIVSAYRRKRRAGASLAELVVAGSLLIAATGLVATSAVGDQRLARLERQNRMAVDELSNQIERLSILPAAQVASALGELSISSWAEPSLVEATMTGQLIDDEYGQRIELTIQWKRPGESKPVSAVAWLSEQKTDAGETR